jgi:translocation and assembly module TamB
VIDKSEFTYIYRSETYDQIGEGLVEFFDPSKPIDTSTAEKTRRSKLGFQLLMNMYIKITPASTVTIVLDEISGDHLKLKGNADLNFVMKPGGGMDLVGAYVLDAGEYDLSIAGLIRKKFQIVKGSTINWAGDPLKGNMDITAKYETRISAGELVNDIDHIPGIDKQKLNFDVLIMLKKELLKPDISFKLDMDERDQEAFDGVIYTRVKQINNIPAELNKQVMGVLAFNQFIAENPFSSFTSSGGDFSTQAFNTAGKLLTQELTDLVGQYVKDINIDFGLERDKDYTSGQAIERTDLQVGVSKSFANNRLNVYVGSTFALEGTNQDEDALSGLAGDITLEYLLTTDGKYRLKGYRLTDNDLTFQGNIVRTGVSFVVVLEFNKFKNMFKSSKKKSS